MTKILKYSSIIFLLLLTTIGFSQDIYWGKSQLREKEMERFQVDRSSISAFASPFGNESGISNKMYYNGNNAYLINILNTKTVVFRKYNKQLNLEFETLINLPFGDASYNTLGPTVIFSGDEIFIAGAEYIKGEDTRQLRVFKIKENGVLGDLVFSDKVSPSYVIVNDNHPESVNKNILIVTYYPTPKGKELNVSGKIMSPDFKSTIHSLNFKIPVDIDYNFGELNLVGNTTRFHNLLLVKDNSIHGVFNLRKKQKSRMKGDNPFHFKAFSFYPGSNEYKVWDLTAPDQYISGIKLTMNNKEQVVMSGIYTTYGTEMFNGIFIAYLDINAKKIISKTDSPIEAKQLEKYFKGKREIQNTFIYKFMRINEDGTVDVVIENSYPDPYFEAVDGFNIHYGFLCYIKFDSNGRISVFADVPKFQATNNTLFSSNVFSTLVYTDSKNTYLIYHDLDVNLNEVPDKMKTVQLIGGASTFIATIDAKGVATRKILYNFKEAKPILKPLVSYQLGNEIIFYGYRDNSYSLGRITY